MTQNSDINASEWPVGSTVSIKSNGNKGHVVGHDTKTARVYIELKSGAREWHPAEDLTLVAPPTNMPVLPNWIGIGVDAQNDNGQIGKIESIHWTPKSNQWLMTFKSASGIEDLLVSEIAPLEQGSVGDNNRASQLPEPAEEKLPVFYKPKAKDYPHISEGDLYSLEKLMNDVYMEGFHEATGKNAEWVGGLQEAIYMHFNDVLGVKNAEIQKLKDQQAATAQPVDNPYAGIVSALERLKVTPEDEKTKPVGINILRALESLQHEVDDVIRKGYLLTQTKAEARIAELTTNVRVQSNMIDGKNQQVMELNSELQRAKDRLEALEVQAEAVPETSGKSYVEEKSLMQDMTTPSERTEADIELQTLRNGEGWSVSYVNIMPIEAGFTRYVLLERWTSTKPPVPQKQTTAAVAVPRATTIPEPAQEAVIDHTIIVGTPETPERVIVGQQPVDASTLDALSTPGGAAALVSTSTPIAKAIAAHGVGAVKAAMNQAAIQAGANAAAAKYAELTANDDDDDSLLPLPATAQYTDFLVR